MRPPSLQLGLQPNQLGIVLVENDVTGSRQERDVAAKALAHKDTLTVVHLDPLGRSFVSIEDNGPFGQYETRSECDIRGDLVKGIDSHKNTALTLQSNLCSSVKT